MLFWLFMLIVIAATGVAGWWGYRAYVTGDTNFALGTWFGPQPEPRLSVMEQASVDGRRKLVLIRRDDVEHLIMTGGPVDVVIETGIQAPTARPHAAEELEPPAFARQHRSFGQAVNE